MMPGFYKGSPAACVAEIKKCADDIDCVLITANLRIAIPDSYEERDDVYMVIRFVGEDGQKDSLLLDEVVSLAVLNDGVISRLKCPVRFMKPGQSSEAA